MFYRVQAILFFTSQDEANDFYHDCEVALPKSDTINPGQEVEQKGYIALERCLHDESVVESCEIISEEYTP